MIIKKFQAKTEEAALELARKELGSGIVVMNVKKVKKKGLFSIFKPQQIEVTVALEEEENRISAKRLRRSVRSPDRVKRRETPGARKRNRNSRQSRERQSRDHSRRNRDNRRNRGSLRKYADN